MTLDNELGKIEKTLAESCLVSYEPQLLRIATEYRDRLAEAVGLIEDLCNEWGMWYVAEEFRARLEGENNG